ncbi:MAG TPA: FHA domain-containing protein, partial [Acidimicrobiales bacterium]|nr:FHA domain-containing protein [Acidimicrobiales bacterium]
EGLVARFGDALVLVSDVGQHRDRAEDLLEAVEAAASGTAAPGPVIAARLAAIIANGEPGTVPAFGVVAPLEDGYLVLLHGLVSAEITGAPGVLRLSGEQAVTWVDQRVQVPVDRLSVTCREHPIKVDPMSDLRAGLVPGSGFVLTPGGRSGEAAGGGPSATHTTQSSEGPAAREVGSSRARQVEGGAGAAGAGASGATTAARQTAEIHPAETSGAGAPDAVTTSEAGKAEQAVAEPLVAEPVVAEPVVAEALVAEPAPAGLEAGAAVGPGPMVTDESSDGGREGTAPQPAARSTEALVAPVGHLVSGDGVRIPLDRDYVLGREPETDPTVRSGAATPIRLADDENLISRVHSYIGVEAGEVSLRDASSANGTYVAAPGDEAWTSVGSDPVPLAPTWSLRVGNLVFTYVATGVL